MEIAEVSKECKIEIVAAVDNGDGTFTVTINDGSTITMDKLANIWEPDIIFELLLDFEVPFNWS